MRGLSLCLGCGYTSTSLQTGDSPTLIFLTRPGGQWRELSYRNMIKITSLSLISILIAVFAIGCNEPTRTIIKPIWSVEIETYDSVSNKMKRYYSTVLMREDTIKKIWLDNKTIIDTSSFLSPSDNNNCAVSEITVKGGAHYKITVLINGVCTDKTKLDSAYTSIDCSINAIDDNSSNDN